MWLQPCATSVFLLFPAAVTVLPSLSIWKKTDVITFDKWGTGEQIFCMCVSAAMGNGHVNLYESDV